MPESSLTFGNIVGLIFGTIMFLGILQVVMVNGGVYNPAINSGTPAGNYIKSIFGSNSLITNLNSTVQSQATLPFARSANESANATTPSSLAQTSGYAFIAGGIGDFIKGIWNFPGIIWTTFTVGLNYQSFQRLIPISIAGMLSIVLLGYLGVIFAMKIVSFFTKPGASIENI